MIDKVPDTFERVGGDVNPHTIAALIAIRDIAENLPEKLSEDEYEKIKGTSPRPISSWLRIVASFGAKFEAGYARRKGSDETTFVLAGKRSAQKQSRYIKNVVFEVASYEKYTELTECLIYCDPPYEGTTSYKTKVFDHAKFWNWCRKMSDNNLVFISEYNAPGDFMPVWSGEIKTNFSSTRPSATHNAVEKLFVYDPLAT